MPRAEVGVDCRHGTEKPVRIRLLGRKINAFHLESRQRPPVQT
jgi:hypothetical protein